jgi:hypothetical protein
MRTLILLPLLILPLSGCHFFKAKTSGDLGELPKPGEKRSIATSEEGRQLYSQNDQNIASGKCGNEVQHRINLYRADRSWSKAPPNTDGSSTFVTPSSQLGRWIGVRKFLSGEMQFLVLTKGRTEIYSFSESCAMTKDVRQRNFTRPQVQDTGPQFTDDDLERLIERTSSYGVIYVWSPGMGYSYTTNTNPDGSFTHVDRERRQVSGIKNAQDAAAEVGRELNVTMSFTAVVDPFTLRPLVQRAYDAGNHDLKPEMLKRMAAFELQMRSMGQHYPSLLVYGNGKIYRQMRPGLTTAASYRKFIEDAVKALQQ